MKSHLHDLSCSRLQDFASLMPDLRVVISPAAEFLHKAIQAEEVLNVSRELKEPLRQAPSGGMSKLKVPYSPTLSSLIDEDSGRAAFAAIPSLTFPSLQVSPPDSISSGGNNTLTKSFDLSLQERRLAPTIRRASESLSDRSFVVSKLEKVRNVFSYDSINVEFDISQIKRNINAAVQDGSMICLVVDESLKDSVNGHFIVREIKKYCRLLGPEYEKKVRYISFTSNETMSSADLELYHAYWPKNVSKDAMVFVLNSMLDT